MENQVFVSPGVKFSERDLSFVSQSLGITSLGLVGETTKGPAFQPIPIRDRNQMRTVFGAQSGERIGNQPKYQLPYVANSYLEESNQLYVTRVLGKSGYNAGKGWAITIAASADPATVVGGTPTGGTSAITGRSIDAYPFIDTMPVVTGTTVSGTSAFVRTGLQLSAVRVVAQTTSYNFAAQSGTCAFTATTVTALPDARYENMVVAIVRSRADYALNNLTFRTASLSVSGNTGKDVFNEFSLVATNGAATDIYNVSLLDTSRNYLPGVIGATPKGKSNRIYCEAIYPELIKKLAAEGKAYGVNTQLVELSTPVFTDYTEGYTTPSTPYVVSELRGNTVERLFRFVSISDGAAANTEIKVSIDNIDLSTGEFDVVVRDFNDTDDNISVLETFSRCTMRKSDSSYVGRRIGVVDEKGDSTFTILSNYLYLEINEDAPEDSVPAGFEGYLLRSYSAQNTGSLSAVTPSMVYKTGYTSDDRVRRTYLGISEKALGFGNGINEDLFAYTGKVKSASGYTKTHGFHLDKDTAATDFGTAGKFVAGGGTFKGIDDTLNPANPYSVRKTAKFTLVFYGGHDGWDEHRTERTNKGNFKKGKPLYLGADIADYHAYLDGIRTFANPEEVYVNVFATPGINWDEHTELVNEAIEMVEEERSDCLYIIDAPDIPGDAGMVEQYADRLGDRGLDTSWAATYGPWCEVSDTANGINLFIAPTAEVVKALAFTDNRNYPWFAPAGMSRGATRFRRARRKLSLTERDTLYAANINPMATFNETGVTIFGQKTLQVKDSLLDRVNVRRLLLHVRKLISVVANRLLFEQNDQATKDEFLTKVNPLLENIRRERGLFEFRVIMDSSNNPPELVDRNMLVGHIKLKPVAALEFISIPFTLYPSGASFDRI